MKEFLAAAEEVVEIDDWIEFKYHGTLCRAVRVPGDGQIAFLMANSADRIEATKKIGALLNFFDSVLDDDTHAYVSNRLLDQKDKFGIENIQEILAYLMEEWSGRPTQRPSGSTSLPPPSGPGLNLPTPASIS